MHTVYCLSKGKHAYIGMTQNVKVRLACHRSRTTNENGAGYYNGHLYTKLRELGGIDAMQFTEIGQYKSYEQASELEKHLIATLQPSLNTQNVHLYDE